MRSIFVGGLDIDCSADEVKGYFSQIHPVGNVYMPLKRKTGKCKGFAFVNLLVTCSQNFDELLSGEHIIRGRKVDVEESFSLDENLDRIRKLQENKIFIGKFPRSQNLQDIAKKLSEYCEVRSCSFVNTKAKRKLLLVLVELADPQVCTQLSKTGFYYQGFKYEVSLYKPKTVWVGEAAVPSSLFTTKLASQTVEPQLEEYGSSLAHSIERSKFLNQSVSNYRFNVVYNADRSYAHPQTLDSFQDACNQQHKLSKMCSSTTILPIYNQSLRSPHSASNDYMLKRGLPTQKGGLTALEGYRMNRAMERKPTVQPTQGTDDCLNWQLFPSPSSFVPASRNCHQNFSH